MHLEAMAAITKTYLYNDDPLKPHFYIVKLGFTEVNTIFLISAQKRRLYIEGVLTSTHNLCFEHKYEKFIFTWKFFRFFFFGEIFYIFEYR